MRKERTIGGRKRAAVRRGHAAHTKGLQLEEDFAAWMKKRMGYDHVRMRQRVRGRIATRPYEIDLHGVKGDLRMKLLQWAGYGLIVLAGVLFLGELPEVRQALRASLALLHPALAGFTLLILGLVGVLVGRFGRKRRVVHAWVECKAYKTTVRREQVQKLIASVDDFRKNDDAHWKPDRVLFVADTGFDVDALTFARAYDIDCYVRDGKRFRKVA